MMDHHLSRAVSFPYFKNNFPFWGEKLHSFEAKEITWYLKQTWVQSNTQVSVWLLLKRGARQDKTNQPTIKLHILCRQSHFNFHLPPLSLQNSGSLSSWKLWIYKETNLFCLLLHLLFHVFTTQEWNSSAFLRPTSDQLKVEKIKTQAVRLSELVSSSLPKGKKKICGFFLQKANPCVSL